MGTKSGSGGIEPPTDAGEVPEDVEMPEVLEVPLTDELDLHTFLPGDVPSLIPEYVEECLRRGFREVRIVHGKGRGVLRRAVHAALDRHPGVVSYRPADEWAGGWGATLVTLAAPDTPPEGG